MPSQDVDPTPRCEQVLDPPVPAPFVDLAGVDVSLIHPDGHRPETAGSGSPFRRSQQAPCNAPMPVVRVHHQVRNVGNVRPVGQVTILGSPLDRECPHEVAVALCDPDFPASFNHRAELLTNGVRRPATRATHCHDGVFFLKQRGSEPHVCRQIIRQTCGPALLIPR